MLCIRRDNINNNSGPNICGRNLVSNQNGESVIQAGEGFSPSISKLCQDCISFSVLPSSLWKQFFTGLNVCGLIAKLSDQQKNITALLTPLFFVDRNTCTTCKAVQSRNFYSLPKQGFYLCHILGIHILELDLSLFCLTIKDFFQENCIIRKKGSFSSGFLFVILETNPSRHRTAALFCSN